MVLVTDLGWYAHRLRSMSVREVVWRASRPLRDARARGVSAHDAGVLKDSLDFGVALKRFRSSVDRPVLLDREHAQGIRAENPALVDSLLSAADVAVQGSFSFFGYPTATFDYPIDWNYDPVADVHWPRIRSERISHRVGHGDVKWIWELNRLQHLPWLVQAWLFSGDTRYEHAAFDHLDSWIAQNPPGCGIAWRSGFEAGIRAISIAIAVQGLRDSAELTVDRFSAILTVLAECAKRCWQDRSLYSSANNHLVGEMAGLAVVALLLPELALSSEWEVSAVRVLRAEADQQILGDGAGAEQAVGYQIFTVELLNLVAALLARRDGHAPDEIVSAIARSSAFLTGVIGERDPDPRYGDNDDGFALRLGPEAVRTVRDHLGIVSIHDWRALSPPIGNDTLAAQWFKAMARSSLAEVVAPARSDGHPASFFARDGGLVVMRDSRRRTMMDVGPLGYLSIAAHGHADALAISLSLDGQDVISDPGTGSYHGHQDWRSAMRSTRAHATVCIDDQNQSINCGPFLWRRHARARVSKVDLAAGVIDAEHDGYTRLPGHPVHRRWLIASCNERSQLVVDLISGQGHHEVRTTWPLHPSLDAERSPFGHIVSREGCPVVQFLSASTAPLALDEVRGDERNNLGWWSDRLETRTPAWWLGAVSKAELPIVIATLITPMGEVGVDGLKVEMQNDLIVVRWEEGGETRTVDIPCGLR